MRRSRNPTLIEALAVEMKARRLELGLSQEELASRCEIDRPYVSMIEIGRKQPTISVLFSISNALELSFGAFAAKIDRRYQRHLRATERLRGDADD